MPVVSILMVYQVWETIIYLLWHLYHDNMENPWCNLHLLLVEFCFAFVWVVTCPISVLISINEIWADESGYTSVYDALSYVQVLYFEYLALASDRYFIADYNLRLTCCVDNMNQYVWYCCLWYEYIDWFIMNCGLTWE